MCYRFLFKSAPEKLHLVRSLPGTTNNLSNTTHGLKNNKFENDFPENIDEVQ